MHMIMQGRNREELAADVHVDGAPQGELAQRRKQVRGQRRVWLWLVVPLFAILYSILGAIFAVFLVHHRGEAVIDQIERQREGWPEAQVITEFTHLNLDGAGTFREELLSNGNRA